VTNPRKPRHSARATPELARTGIRPFTVFSRLIHFRTKALVGWLSLALLATLPQLETLTNRDIAALVPVTPYNQASSTLPAVTPTPDHPHIKAHIGWLKQERHNPIIRAFYHRLYAAGKATKTALTAPMGKLLTLLNGMLKHRAAWYYASPHYRDLALDS
jgi:transposase